MSDDAFAAPDEAPPPGRLPTSVRIAQGTLLFVAGTYMLMALVISPMYAVMPFLDPELRHASDELKYGLSGGLGLTFFVCLGGFALIPGLAAYGLQKRAMWGWIMALIVGGMLVPSACLPFGAAILYGILTEEGRDIYLKS